MAELLNIGQAARAIDVPTSTLRYYDRIGLVRPSGRSAANYRLYGPDDLDRLRFVRAAQANGFTLEDVTQLLALRTARQPPSREVQAMIARRIADLDQRIAEMRHLQEVLHSLMHRCRAGAGSGRCEVLISLQASPPKRRGAR